MPDRHLQPVPDRVAFVADLAANWVRLRSTPAAERKVAIILANYPNKDGRIANGVGYDTPASTVAILDAMAAEGYSGRRLSSDRQRHHRGFAVADRPTRLRVMPGSSGHRCPARPAGGLSRLTSHRTLPKPSAHRSPRAGASHPAIPSSPMAHSTCRPPLRQCRRRHPAGARLQHRSEVDLSRPRPRAAARLSRLLFLAPPSLRRPCRHPQRQARQSRMAAGQGQCA